MKATFTATFISLLMASPAFGLTCNELFSQALSPLIARDQLAPTSDPEFNVTHLETVVKKSRSVEDVLGQLPASLRRDFVLVMDSKSSQHGDTKNPRVILSNADSTLLFTFTGQPESRGGRVIEAITFDRATNEFTPYEMEFLQDGTSRTTKNPERCAGCHGVKFRPIWDSYPFWPRVIGGIEKYVGSKLATKTEKSIAQRESKLYQNFLEKGGRSGRYATLVKPSDTGAFGRINTALSNNLVTFKMRQIRAELAEIQSQRPEIGNLISKVIKSLANEMSDNYAIEQELPVDAQKLFRERFSQILSETREQLKKQRLRKVNQHLEMLGRKPVDVETAMNTTQISITDFDLRLSAHSNADENLRSFENTAAKFANLRFLVETVMGRSLTDWGMSVYRSELPTLTSGKTFGWELLLPPERR